MYGYHDCAMDILTCVTDLFANRHNATGNNSGRDPLFPLIDDRRYRPLTPPSKERSAEESIWTRRHNTPHPPVKPASLPSLQLSDNDRRSTKKRRKRWANSKTHVPLVHLLNTRSSDGRTVGLPPLVTLTPNLVMLLLPVSRNDRMIHKTKQRLLLL